MDGHAKPADFGEAKTRYEQIGLSPEAGWYNAATMGAIVGTLVTAIYYLTDWLPPGMQWIGFALLATVPLWLLGARFMPRAEWTAHVRMMTGMIVATAAAFLLGPLLTATALSIMLPLAAVAVLAPVRVALAYGALALLTTVPMLAAAAPPAAAIATTAALAATALCVTLSQHQLRTLAQATIELAELDPLTGVANMRKFQSRLEFESARADRTGEMPFLIALDLDDFKLVNDRFSHSLGDEVLRATAAEIASKLAPADLQARRGGDEFVVLCAPLDDRDPAELSGRIKRGIKSERQRVCPEVNSDASVGWVQMRPGDSAETVLARADDALHRAKLAAHPERGTPQLGRQDSPLRARGVLSERKSTVDFRASGSGDQAAIDLELTRRAKRVLSPRGDWLQAMQLNTWMAIVVLVVWLAGLLETSRPVLIGIGASMFLIAALAAAIAARGSAPARWLAVVPLSMTITLLVVCAGIGANDWLIADLFLVPMLFAPFKLDGKVAATEVAATVMAFAAVLIASDYAHAPVRIVIALCVVSLITSLLIKTQRRTREFAREAIGTSTIDALTGVANLRALRGRVTDEIDRSSANGPGQLVALSIDLDEFKLVNDRHSHTHGDAMLVAVAEAMRSQIRAGDMVARRGGDEFSVIASLTASERPEILVKRVCRAIELARLQQCPDLTPTVSVGIARLRPEDTLDQFLDRCDDQLHHAKMRSRAARDAMESDFDEIERFVA